MGSFGHSKSRGRRVVPRSDARSIAILSWPLGHHPVGLIDISRTGVRVCGEILPGVGEPLTFRAEDVKAIGQVVWRKGQTCAVEFDTPVSTTEVQQLRSYVASSGLGHTHERPLA
jgi:hypothetical protein